jgi:hypothetical protein
MKMELSQTLVGRLRIEEKPYFDPHGRVGFAPNPARTPYIVFDSHKSAPRGFGINCHRHGASYLIQRRVGDKVFKAKVCDIQDMPIADARIRAGELATEMRTTGANPNVTMREGKRRKALSQITLRQALTEYREYLTSRSRPAKASSLKVLDSTTKRLGTIIDKPLPSLRSTEILHLCDAYAKQARTACEQAFRWANAAIRYVIKREAVDAANENRTPALTANPFVILEVEDKFRTKAQLEKEYQARGVRNPMAAEDGSLGRFLIALWERRKRNRTGGDYLLLTLLFGTRESELAPLAWRDQLTAAEARTMAWFDMEARKIWIPDTKNHFSHELPVPDAAFAVLQQRFDDRLRHARYVFPNRSSKRSRSPHLVDADTLLDFVRADAGIERLTTHDTRRTFGRFAEDLVSYKMVKQLLNHRKASDTTERYTEAEWRSLANAIQRVELAMLSTAPAVYNRLLLPPQYPPLPLVDPKPAVGKPTPARKANKHGRRSTASKKRQAAS